MDIRNRSFMCTRCDILLENVKAYMDHFHVHHNQNDIICHICQKEGFGELMP